MSNTSPDAATPMLTAAELAAALKVHHWTVNRWAREGRIPYLHVGGTEREDRRYDLDAVKAALAKPATSAEAAS